MSLAHPARPVPIPLAPLHARSALPLDDHDTRKRTSSFSFPRPAKLTRHESVLYVHVAPPAASTAKVAAPAASNASSTPASSHNVTVCCRTLQMYKEQKARRRPPPLTRSGAVLSISTTPLNPPNAPLPAPPRASSLGTATASTSAATTPHAVNTTLPLATRGKPVTPARTSSLPARTLSASPARSTSLPITRSALPRPVPAPKPARYAPSQVILPSPSSSSTNLPTLVGPTRSCSPLVPAAERASTPSRSPRPLFPRARAPVDLYRAALRAAMAATPEGRRVLLMGARLAVSIDQATRELERLVEGRGEGGLQETKDDEDVVMGDDTESLTVSPSAVIPPTAATTTISTTASISPLSTPTPVPPLLTASWVVVHPGSKVEDWEMVDCAA